MKQSVLMCRGLALLLVSSSLCGAQAPAHTSHTASGQFPRREISAALGHVESSRAATYWESDATIPASPTSALDAETITAQPELADADATIASESEFIADDCVLGFNGLDARANADCDAQNWLGGYLQRAAIVSEEGLQPNATDDRLSVPPDFTPWWISLVQASSGLATSTLEVDVQHLVQSALCHSPHVRAVTTEPHIRQTMLVEEHAQFDWRNYLESTFDDINEPIGNTLTTGNNDRRFKDQQWSAQGGYRRRNEAGGKIDIHQQLGHRRNNSIFFIPQPQGTSRLELSYTQPLLNGRGSAYNLSHVVQAEIGVDLSRDEVLSELQDHLLKVTESYWDLYRARAGFFQRKRLLERAESILENLQGRQQVDVLQRQVLRARAAVSKRRSELARAATSIRNAEATLRLLVNDPVLLDSASSEFTPVDMPHSESIELSMRDSLNMALLHRPDISVAIRELRTTSVDVGVARNEILPKLDLLVSSYVAGLEGRGNFAAALGNQFADGRPSYSVGLMFEMPVGNRAAKARLARRQWEMVRAMSRFRATVAEALTEVEVSVREVQTTYQEMVGKYHAMVAAENETEYLMDRWFTLPGLDDSSTLLLEDLLDSQERLTEEEEAFVTAQVHYAVSLIHLRKSMGTLLRAGKAQSTRASVAPTVADERADGAPMAMRRVPNARE